MGGYRFLDAPLGELLHLVPADTLPGTFLSGFPGASKVAPWTNRMWPPCSPCHQTLSACSHSPSRPAGFLAHLSMVTDTLEDLWMAGPQPRSSGWQPRGWAQMHADLKYNFTSISSLYLSHN